MVLALGFLTTHMHANPQELTYIAATVTTKPDSTSLNLYNIMVLFMQYKLQSRKCESKTEVSKWWRGWAFVSWAEKPQAEKNHILFIRTLVWNTKNKLEYEKILKLETLNQVSSVNFSKLPFWQPHSSKHTHKCKCSWHYNNTVTSEW